VKPTTSTENEEGDEEVEGSTLETANATTSQPAAREEDEEETESKAI
jgi:hypothetical protein